MIYPIGPSCDRLICLEGWKEERNICAAVGETRAEETTAGVFAGIDEPYGRIWSCQ